MSTTTQSSTPVTSAPAPVASKPDFAKKWFYGKRGMAIMFTNPENGSQFASIKFNKALKPLQFKVERIDVAKMEARDINDALYSAVNRGGISLLGDKPYTKPVAAPAA